MVTVAGGDVCLIADYYAFSAAANFRASRRSVFTRSPGLPAPATALRLRTSLPGRSAASTARSPCHLLHNRTAAVQPVPVFEPTVERTPADRDKAQGSNFTVRFRHRDGNRLGVDIQTNNSYFMHRTDSPFACGSAPLVSYDSQRNPRTANWKSDFLFPFHVRPNSSRFVHDD
jgi:hypothetical protein